jgi:hypothetical protein
MYGKKIKSEGGKICHSKYDAIVTFPYADFHNILRKTNEALYTVSDIEIECTRNEIMFSGVENMIHVKVGYTNNITHKNEIDNRIPKLICGKYSTRELRVVNEYSCNVGTTLTLHMIHNKKITFTYGTPQDDFIKVTLYNKN